MPPLEGGASLSRFVEIRSYNFEARNGRRLSSTRGGAGQRETDQGAFYGSAEWKDGPRDAILALIESYTTVVLEVDDPTLKGLRRDP